MRSSTEEYSFRPFGPDPAGTAAADRNSPEFLPCLRLVPACSMGMRLAAPLQRAAHLGARQAIHRAVTAVPLTPVLSERGLGMMRTDRFLLSLVVIPAFALGAAYSAGAVTVPATTPYGDYNGTHYDFTNVNETVQSEETVPLFEAPNGVGDQLQFSPSSFDAASSGGSGIDTTHSTFHSTISSNGAATIDLISIDEAGDITLSDFPAGSGTAATAVTAALSGTIMITDALNPADIGTQITFGGTGGDFDTTFTAPGGPFTNSLYVGLQPAGTFSWTGSVDIDIASLVSGVTGVELQLNNILQANSESGTSASIQKKAANGVVITVIPEPGTLVLMAPGLIALAFRARRRRA